MSWIRVATAMKGDPRIGAIATDVKRDVGAVVGYVVALLSDLPTHARDGDLTHISDASLEQWAMWPGRRGVFARAFVAHMCEGRVVRAWEKHNGAPLRELDAKRQAMAEKRAKEKGPRTGPPPATPPDCYPHGRGNGGGDVPESLRPYGTVRTQQEYPGSSQILPPDPTTAADAAPSGPVLDVPLRRALSRQREPAEFREAWVLYPDRQGDNPRGRAVKAFVARLRSGVRPTELVEGVRRYRAYCDATGRSGGEFVMQAATFFGPDERYAAEWTLPTATDDPLERLAREQQAQFAADDAWMAARRAKVPA